MSGVRDKIAKAIAGIRAYHSSPHDFDKFDLNKIGTGEGAQVYGHGLYFAENPAVSGQGGQYWNSFSTHPSFSEPEWRAASRLRSVGFDRQKAIAETQRDVRDWRDALKSPEHNPENAKKMLALRESELEMLLRDAPVGPRTYEVDIKADPSQFLDWDRQVTARAPQPIREALNTIANNNRGPLKDALWTAAREEQPGWYFYSRLMDHAKTGDLARNQAYATDMLREAGVPGIKYLDQGSRAAGTGSSNYVVFDPGIVDIVKKYGVVGAPAGMGALAAQDQYEVQP